MLDKSYHKYIQSEKWKIKREAYFAARGRYCKACRSTSNIKIHHMSYANFGNEPLSDLVSLCNPCHVEVHRLHRKAGRKADLRLVTLKYIKDKTLQRLRQKTPRR
jgi:hypothetical protein